VTGNVPFDAATFNQLMFKIVLAEVPTVESVVPDMDPAYSSIISKAMARDVAHRFQSTAEFIKALDEWMARGTAVSIPPRMDGAEAGLVPQPGRPAMGSAPGLARTPSGVGGKTAGNWATSQPNALPEEEPPKKRGTPLALVAGAAVLVVAGGAFAALQVMGKAPPPAAEASAGQPAAPPPPATPPPPVAQTAATPPPEVTPTSAEAKVAPAPSASVVTSAKAAVAAAPPPAAPRPFARPQPAAHKSAKAADAKPAPASKPASSPDFGY
jgi:serine/threonine-protein kinase